MKRVTIAVLPLLVLALALPAFGQQGKNLTTDPGQEDTVQVTVNGGIVLDYVYRSKEMTHFIGGFTSFGAADPTDESTVEGEVYVGLNIALNDNISGVFEIGTIGVDEGATLYYGTGGGAIPEFAQIREAHANISEFLSPNVNLQLGITTWSFDVRGKGSSFAFDPRHSSSITKNLDTVAMDDDMMGGNLLDVLESAGIVATWSNDQIKVDVVFLPTVLEAGAPTDDEALYAVDFYYTLDADSGSRVAAILAMSSHGGSVANPGINAGTTAAETSIFTFGGGVTLNNLVENLELYGEIYFQFGDAGHIAGSTADAGGMAFQAGLEYNLGGPWVGLIINLISGDSDTTANTDVDAFVSYENVNDLVILEDMWWGFDWDSNYFAVKIPAGITFSVAGGDNNFALEGILGFARTVEDVEGLGTAGTSGESALGTEFDVKATWALNSQFDLHAAVAFLIGSDVLEGSLQQHGVTNDDDSAALFYLGFGLSM